MLDLLLNRFWKMFLIAALAMVWATACIWSNGGHFAFVLAGVVTSIILLVMTVIYCDNDE
jgi:uncharacterized membrane protein YhiD involved in acid resistance